MDPCLRLARLVVIAVVDGHEERLAECKPIRRVLCWQGLIDGHRSVAAIPGVVCHEKRLTEPQVSPAGRHGR